MWPGTLAHLGMVVCLLSCAMDGIIKLRVISIASSGVFLIYAIITVSYRTIVEQLLALPVNGYGPFKMLRQTTMSSPSRHGPAPPSQGPGHDDEGREPTVKRVGNILRGSRRVVADFL
jgi:hypothetical protein